MALYLACDEQIPTTEWSTGSALVVQALEPTEEKVRRQFTKQNQPIDIALFAAATGGPCEPRPAIWGG